MSPGGFPMPVRRTGDLPSCQAQFQGTYVDTRHTQIDKLVENISNARITSAEQGAPARLAQTIERAAPSGTGSKNSQIDSRIQSFELGYRMQLEATDAFDVSREPESIRKMYGEGTQARQILIARRLLERGVRFVQVWHSAGAVWDHHENLEAGHRKLALECDQAIGACSKTSSSGACSTIRSSSGEASSAARPPSNWLMGISNNRFGKGRDHNHHGFTVWMAGGGVKGGYVHGATDEFGFRAVEKKVHVHDLHATILHLLGFDHTN